MVSWKGCSEEIFVAPSKEISRNYPGGAKENQEDLQPG
jgi:hypothetical protein